MAVGQLVYVGKVKWWPYRARAAWRALCALGMALRGYEVQAEVVEEAEARTLPPIV